MFIPHRYYRMVACVLVALVLHLWCWTTKILWAPRVVRNEGILLPTIVPPRLSDAPRSCPDTPAQVGFEQWRENLRYRFIGTTQKPRAPNPA